MDSHPVEMQVHSKKPQVHLFGPRNNRLSEMGGII
jgi:hypothetical protein